MYQDAQAHIHEHTHIKHKTLSESLLLTAKTKNAQYQNPEASSRNKITGCSKKKLLFLHPFNKIKQN